MKSRCYKLKQIHCPVCDHTLELAKTVNLSIYRRKHLWFAVSPLPPVWGVGGNKKAAVEDYQTNYCGFCQEQPEPSEQPDTPQEESETETNGSRNTP